MTTPKPRTRDECGASAVEYALLIAGVAAVIVTVIVLLGGNVSGLLADTCDDIQQKSQNAAC